MLFYTFSKMLLELEAARMPGLDQPFILVRNGSLERWALLNLSNDNDKVQYFEDPSNQLACLAMPSDSEAIPSDFKSDDFEEFTLYHMNHVLGNPLKHTLRMVLNYYFEDATNKKAGQKSKLDSSTNATDVEPSTTVSKDTETHAQTAPLASSSERSSKTQTDVANSN